MSENKNKQLPREPISEEQLDDVSGGGTSTESFPIRSPLCWFKMDGRPREDGRMPCSSECTRYIEADNGSGQWRTCACLDTNNCIDRWHKTCGKPPAQMQC